MGDQAALRKTFLKKLRMKVRHAGLDAFLVTGEKDIRYLTGYFAEGAKLLVPARSRPVYLIDTMNEALCRECLSGFAAGDILAGPSHKRLRDHAAKAGLKRIGIDENAISAREYRTLMGGGRFRFRHDRSMIEEMRLLKEESEVDIIRKAARKTVRIWKEVRKNLETGMTEKDIAGMIDVLIRAMGHGNAFPTIVAIGENTAFPHAIPGRRKLKNGEHLLVDFGIRTDGYCSDLTRTYANGRIDRKISSLKKHVLKAHDRAIKMVKPGVAAGSLDAEARNYFDNNKVGRHILHSLGHGVGMDVHERPFLREGNPERLRKGMVFTIEPGLYEPGVGGVREEDMVLVTSNGCEVLTV